MLLSLFCGAGGLDLGFEQAGYNVGLAFDIRKESIASYNYNRKEPGKVAHCKDITKLSIEKIDWIYGGNFSPSGIIGGPPCQSFSRANKSPKTDDPRHELPFVYTKLISDFNQRNLVPFFVFENVPGINEGVHKERYIKLKKSLKEIGFNLTETILNSSNFGVPQTRERLFLVGINIKIFGDVHWTPPEPLDEIKFVRHAIKELPEPVFFEKGLTPEKIGFHPNHWCMKPKSSKFFTPGALRPGDYKSRSFKTLSWDAPSITVAYGNREVHVHPSTKRRLSVYEAMLLQGFPKDYVLLGNLSEQITQVSEAVPPPLAFHIAKSLEASIKKVGDAEKELMV